MKAYQVTMTLLLATLVSVSAQPRPDMDASTLTSLGLSGDQAAAALADFESLKGVNEQVDQAIADLSLKQEELLAAPNVDQAAVAKNVQAMADQRLILETARLNQILQWKKSLGKEKTAVLRTEFEDSLAIGPPPGEDKPIPAGPPPLPPDSPLNADQKKAVQNDLQALNQTLADSRKQAQALGNRLNALLEQDNPDTNALRKLLKDNLSQSVAQEMAGVKVTAQWNKTLGPDKVRGLQSVMPGPPLAAAPPPGGNPPPGGPGVGPGPNGPPPGGNPPPPAGGNPPPGGDKAPPPSGGNPPPAGDKSQPGGGNPPPPAGGKAPPPAGGANPPAAGGGNPPPAGGKAPPPAGGNPPPPKP